MNINQLGLIEAIQPAQNNIVSQYTYLHVAENGTSSYKVIHSHINNKYA